LDASRCLNSAGWDNMKILFLKMSKFRKYIIICFYDNKNKIDKIISFLRQKKIQKSLF
jgi:hypothetical protein